MVCDECGAEIDESANFCAKCGARVEKKAESPVVDDENKDVTTCTVREESGDTKNEKGKPYNANSGFAALFYGLMLAFVTYTFSIATVEIKWYFWVFWALVLFAFYVNVKASQDKCKAVLCFNDYETEEGFCAECGKKHKDAADAFKSLKEWKFPGEEISEEETIEPKEEKTEQKNLSKKEEEKVPDESGCGCIIVIVLVLLFGGTFMGLLFDLVLGISLLSLFF